MFRRYTQSSSFKMAALFALLLGMAAAMLGYLLADTGPLRLQLVGALIFLCLLIVVGLSVFISLFVVARINRIADAARDIMQTGDLSRRIAIHSDWDDLSNLAGLLNMLLARIEQLVSGVREVSDNIAHDLRTPLTRLRQRLEDLKARDDSPEVTAALAEADRLLSTFHSLLRIAKIERGAQERSFEAVDLAVLLQDVADLYEPLAEDKQVRLALDLPPSLRLTGDRDLLFQLFANLIDNAVKFSPLAGCVDINAVQTASGLKVTIADAGPGIAEQEREQVFTRFYRSDKSRHLEGNGLGLSLVKAIVERHRGIIALEDNQPGLRAVITFDYL